MSRISVIIPAYNAEATVCGVVESLLHQTYENVEIIVVNDGSRDRTAEKLADYADRIRVIHKENGGVSSARNRGIEEATGEYIMFADADDLYKPEAVEQAVRRAQQTQADFVIAGYTKVTESGSTDRVFGDGVYRGQEEILRHVANLLNEGQNAPFGKLYRTQLIREHNICFDESLPLGEDVNFNLEYLLWAQSLAYLDQPIYLYQNFNSTATTVYRDDMYRRRMMSLNKLNETFQKHGMQNPVAGQMQVKILYAELFNLRHRDCPCSRKEKKQRIRAAQQAYFSQPREKLHGIFGVLVTMAKILPPGGLYAFAGLVRAALRLLPDSVRGVSV